MAEALALRPAPVALTRNLIELGKPRVTLMVVFTTAIGLWLAPSSPGPLVTAGFLAATALLVSSANTLNCYVERETDGRMVRTRHRALPSGRLAPRLALWAGLAQGAAALLILLAWTNPLTAALGAIALSTYVLVYTPLKRVSPLALQIGAVPGAIPPLMGWTAATGHLALPGWMLFGVLFTWQIPHFIAISLYLKDDYRRGGLQVLPVALGDRAARRHLLGYTLALVAVTTAVVPLGIAGPMYGVTALALGGWFVHLAWSGVRREAGKTWARRIFLYSIVYLAALVTVLLVDAR